MEKTISDLNSKGWYRLLKVFFVLSFLVIAGSYNMFIYSDLYKNPESYIEKIICNYGNKKILGSEKYTQIDQMNILEACYGNKLKDRWELTDIKYYISENTSKPNISYTLMDKISGWGYQKEESVNTNYNEAISIALSRRIDEIHEMISHMNLNPRTENEISEGLNSKLYSLSFANSYKKYIVYLILGNFIILGIFEIFRRVFYYVVLGTFKPHKR